ncbi:hypothetical protein [Pseudomonas sp. UBA2684]|uniref:hypothetical protein n=1 Tax=Pseudomonas sp. UBA2684 TaxID=1947311 RepID=UPI000E9CFEAF|nr:hypothetical protein [Pseudomonas sp. UBA2684]HBX53871.1 hypothetical protein [Pseudomonas sp.]|tara:strand:- start:34740 stop:35381 length:642 start_codon:yes stop_codon:yes gene_type:complete
MKDPHATPSTAEQQLLQHYRAHHHDEPSAALDARILAAAAAQVATPPASALARLHAWLFGAAPRMRWSVALGSVALLGLGLGLSLNTLEQAPPAYDHPLPAAPAIQRYAAPAPAAPAPLERKALAESAAALAESAAALADSVATEEQARASSSAPLARSKVTAAPWLDELHEVLALRARGQQAEADTLLDRLRQRYPQQDIDKRLQQLEQADK